ncbi:hypothetical protein RCL10_11665 [Staphylococcus lloydii]|uniref:DUF4097 family beta strand repeat-containing protein n=1 Tax=Staphylococcus lloydii TaxID=2781774 RepID=UPI0029277B1C|nr:DUF4097 family beta strand repeat-containing protein [Staphylococcus lloydii]MDU9419155.1 hypothetical protein [Staphylococcus lloydii]
MKKLFISGLVLFVICFSLACISWFTFEKQDNKTNKAHENVDHKTINSLNVNTKFAKVNVKHGKRLSISYKGTKDIKIDKHNGHLKISEINNNEDHYGLNFNPFRKMDSELTITVPKQQEKSLNMNLNSETIHISDLNLGKVNIKTTYNGGDGLYVKHTQFENLKFRSKSAPVYIRDCVIKNSDIKTTREINVKNSLLKSALLLSKRSNIKLMHMKSTSDIKASTNEGNILMSYATKPKDTLLKLNPDDGKVQVDNKYFKNGKVGNSDNVLEFYTDSGNIHIK